MVRFLAHPVNIPVHSYAPGNFLCTEALCIIHKTQSEYNSTSTIAHFKIVYIKSLLLPGNVVWWCFQSCLSVCMAAVYVAVPVCTVLSSNFWKPWVGKFTFGKQVHLQNVEVIFVYQGHSFKVKFREAKTFLLVLLLLPLPLPSGWTTSSAEAVHQLRPNAQPRT